MLDLEFDSRYAGYGPVCGTDEAGRGPLAGPVVAAAVILPPGAVIEGLDDSKKLTEKKREQLFDVIKEKAVAWGIGIADNKEIDELNILEATKTAMKRAITAVRDMLAERGSRRRQPQHKLRNTVRNNRQRRFEIPIDRRRVGPRKSLQRPSHGKARKRISRIRFHKT